MRKIFFSKKSKNIFIKRRKFIFNSYFCHDYGSCLFQTDKMKRESGENPGQSRCCNLRKTFKQTMPLL